MLLPGIPLSLVACTKMLSKDDRNSCMWSSRLHVMHVLFGTVVLGKTGLKKECLNMRRTWRFLSYIPSFQQSVI